MTDLDRLDALAIRLLAIVERMVEDADDHPLRLVEVSRELFNDQVVRPIRELVVAAKERDELRDRLGRLADESPNWVAQDIRAALHHEDGAVTLLVTNDPDAIAYHEDGAS